MPINYPTYQEVIDRSRSAVRAQLPNADPTLANTGLRALSDGVSSRAFDITLLQRQAVEQFFPQTATGEYLDFWAGYEGLQRLSASSSSGLVVFTGTESTTIPAGTNISSDNGETYITNNNATISDNSFSVLSITRIGTIATVSAVGHPLASGNTVTISGATEVDYNGSFTVTVIDNDSFSYTVLNSPSTPASGTIEGQIYSTSVEVFSSDSGLNSNLDSGALLTLISPISGVDDNAIVRFNALTGGSDIESDDDLRIRVFQSRGNPVANFNSAAIEKEARKISGITRIFIKPVTPQVGDVSVYFLRDNDVNNIPTSAQINEVRTQILTILPATSDPSNVYVQAPNIVNVNFTFSNISPDTSTMRQAISNSLKVLFEDSVEFEIDLSEDKYRAAIINTQDLETGEALSSFTLSVPSGSIAVGDGELAGLGEVTFI